MPFCENCGNRLEDEDMFCPECGTRVTPDVRPSAPAPVRTAQTIPPVSGPAAAFPIPGRVRFRCPQCGNVEDYPNYTMCPRCGQGLSVTGGLLYLYRMGNPYGAAVAAGIYIDGIPQGHIGIKQTVAISLPFGTHNIHVVAAMMRRCNDAQFTITPQSPVAFAKAHINFASWTVEMTAPGSIPMPK